ncbi:MAG: hypothetical protein KC481_02185 [Acidimicrobiaceae bacterium]|nr:hypothetical protein [Acidimicrobiaceae bacterium]MCO4832439.1 hypothetical protein [Acidimicrobiaceae bacterium]
MRRLFVRHEGRGTGLGRRLAEHLVSRPGGIELAPRLNTLPAMVEAQALYSSMGIEPCAPYVGESLDGVLSISLSPYVSGLPDYEWNQGSRIG